MRACRFKYVAGVQRRTHPTFSWSERRRRQGFGWLLLVAFLIQNLGVWVAWRAGSPLQVLLGLVGSGCTLYLMLTNARSVISVVTAYTVGIAFLSFRLAVELADTFIERAPITTAMYLEASLLCAFMVAIFSLKTAARLAGIILLAVFVLTVQGGLHQIVEFMLLFMVFGVLHFTAEYGRQTFEARRRSEELERQLVWDTTTGVASRKMIEERTKVYLSAQERRNHLAVVVTLPDEQQPALQGTVDHLVLQRVVKALRPLLRDHDMIGRWDESRLLLLYPHISAEEQRAVLHTIQETLADLHLGEQAPRVGSVFLDAAPTAPEIVALASKSSVALTG